MSGRAPRKGNQRRRRLWLSTLATVVGLVALTGGAAWVEKSRDTDLADPTAGVSRAFRHEAPDEAPALAWRDRATELGLSTRAPSRPRTRTLPEDTAPGLAWGDVDGDGDFDLFAVSVPGPEGEPADRLWRNDGGRFLEATDAAGLSVPASPDVAEELSMGASFVDLDDDGDVDLYVTRLGPNRLWRNRGDGTFEEVAEELGLADPSWSVGAAWGDVDRDGRLDLYVANYVRWTPEIGSFSGGDPVWQEVPVTLNPNAFDPAPNRLYRQLADGIFEEVALPWGASDPSGRSLSATLVDLDGDDWLDLYVANDVSPNTLLLNRTAELGAGLFEDRSAATGTADPRGSMGIAVTDLATRDEEPDGLPDLFVTHWVAQENALYRAGTGPNGTLEYRDRVRRWRMAEISTEKVGWGCAWLDLDLDGRRDLVVANGSTLEEDAPPRLVAQPLLLLWNDGEQLHDLASEALAEVDRVSVGRGLALADWDLDGDADVALAVNRGGPRLLEADGERRGGWWAIRLRGPESRRRGARLEVISPGDSSTGRQVAWWASEASYASGHADEMLFGLGTSPSATLRVRSSGPADLTALHRSPATVRTWEALPANRRYLVPLDSRETEGS